MTFKDLLQHKIWSDARLWIALFFVVRLYGITQPPLEVVHNWRQCTVAMVARNFAEVDHNILYPRLDIDGANSGIEGMEFPLFNYLIFITSEIFGYQHWYGRLINLLVSSLCIWYFFLLVRKFWNHQMALYAVVILEASMWFVYMRKMMPDTFSVSLILIGVYYGASYLTDGRTWKNLLLYTLFVGAGVLSKISSVSVCVVLLLPFITAGSRQKIVFTLCSALWIVPVAWWYFIWVPYLNANFGTGHFFMGMPLQDGAMQLVQGASTLLAFFYSSTLKYTGFGVFVMGIIIAFYKKEKRILSVLLLTFLFTLLVLAKGGYNALKHDYYLVPFVPTMALLAAYALAQLPQKKWALFLILVIVTEGLLNQLHDFRIKPNEAQMLQLEAILNSQSAPNELIAINSPVVPTPMYFAHRKGWLCANSDLQNNEHVQQLKQQGMHSIVILKNAYDGNCALPYAIEFENEWVKVYRP